MPPTPSPDPLLIKLLGEQSSFWDSTFWVGLLPVLSVLSVLAGAVAAYFFARAQDDRKAKREQSTRWDADLRSLTADVMAYVDELTRQGVDAERQRDSRKHLVEDGVIEEADNPLADLHGVTTTFDAYKTLLKSVSRLQLIAPAHIVRASATLLDDAFDIVFASGEAEAQELAKTVNGRRDDLVAAVRQHFGLHEERSARTA